MRCFRFYDARRRAVAAVAPNAAHRALARLEGAIGDNLLVVTQNVDDLHERAGTRNLVHMHGELRRALCMFCGTRHEWVGDLADLPACPHCGERMLRPDVVWFGEMPYELDRIENAVVACDVFVSIGTSGAVYPAAGYVALAAAFGARTVELNLEPSDAAIPFDESRAGPRDRPRPGVGRGGAQRRVDTVTVNFAFRATWRVGPTRRSSAAR